MRSYNGFQLNRSQDILSLTLRARRMYRTLNSRLRVVVTICLFAFLLCPAPARAVEHLHECRYCRDAAAHLLADSSTAAASNGRHYAPDRHVDVRHIKIDVTPDFDHNTIAATATLRFAPISRPLATLRLDAVDLDIANIRSDHPAESHSADGKNLTIVFAKPIPVDQPVEVAIAYTAEPVKGLYFRTAKMGLPAGDDHCWTQGEPHEARHWFPSFDSPNERASSEIICHVPRAMTVVSNGRLIAETDEPNDMKRVHWLHEKPHVSYLICMVAGHLKKLTARHRDIPLAFYTQPSKARFAANAFQDTAAIMAFYEQEIGVPYPWEKYDQVTCADYHWGGMENTTLTTLNQRAIFSDATENIISNRSLDAHELAHQWFGNYVTCKDWSHIWLNEGFATYYALLYEGHKLGRDHLLYGLYLDARDDIFPSSHDRRPAVYRAYKSPREQFDFRNYPKASWVLHMLRCQLGDDRYRQAIRTYLERHALDDVVTDDLRQSFEHVSGLPLDQFFDQWLYHGGIPELKITYKWLPSEKLAHVAIEQTQSTDNSVLLFDLSTKLRFLVQSDDGAPQTRDEPITIDARHHDFYIPLPAEPKIVRFDPDYTLLARVSFNKPDKLLVAQLLENPSDVIGRVLACDALAKRPTQDAVDALKKALDSDPFFGVRTVAAIALRKIRTPEAVEALVAARVQSDARVRLAVVDELGKCHRGAALDALRDVLDEEQNPAIIAAAVRGLSSAPGKVSAAIAREMLRSQSWGHEPIAAAFLLIRGLNDPSLARDLMKCLQENKSRLDPRDTTEGLLTLAKISQSKRHRRRTYEFLVEYLNQPRQMLQVAAIQALGQLREPKARQLLAPLAENDRNAVVAAAARAALAELDQQTSLAAPEVATLRREQRELRESQKKLQKALDELKSKLTAKNSSTDQDETLDKSSKPSNDDTTVTQPPSPAGSGPG